MVITHFPPRKERFSILYYEGDWAGDPASLGFNFDSREEAESVRNTSIMLVTEYAGSHPEYCAPADALLVRGLPIPTGTVVGLDRHLTGESGKVFKSWLSQYPLEGVTVSDDGHSWYSCQEFLGEQP